MSISQNFPEEGPTLNLNFANSKTLDPRITFTRTSSATYTDDNGLIRVAPANSPRFDHNPTTGESLGLLVEEQRTNLLLRSEEFDDASWTKVNGAISANTAVSPSGTPTADKLIITTGQSVAYAAQLTSVASGITYALSVFAKASEFTNFTLLFPAAGFASNLTAVFNLTSGTVTSFDTASATIVPLGNGWFRCAAVATATATISIAPQIRVAGVGDNTSGIYIWGAQVEAGAFPTSYIPTTGTAATRSADVATMTGSNFSS